MKVICAKCGKHMKRYTRYPNDPASMVRKWYCRVCIKLFLRWMRGNLHRERTFEATSIFSNYKEKVVA